MKRFLSILVLALVLAVGWFVWPTPYDAIVLNQAGGMQTVRVNRLTDYLQVRDRDGQWRDAGPASQFPGFSTSRQTAAATPAPAPTRGGAPAVRHQGQEKQFAVIEEFGLRGSTVSNAILIVIVGGLLIILLTQLTWR